MGKGARDAMSSEAPLLPPSEMHTVLVELQKRIGENARLLHQEEADRNLAEGERFLKENAGKEGVVTLPSGLRYRILKEGGGRTPSASDTVTVHYTGRLIDGTQFDNSFSRNQPTTFKVNGILPGLREAVQLMKAGSKWELFIPPALAYGERGAGPKIEPNLH